MLRPAPEFAAGLMKARLLVELKSTAAQKTSRADVESDLVLLQQLLAPQPKELASVTVFAAESRALSSEDAIDPAQQGVGGHK
jgi:hypothetical protein